MVRGGFVAPHTVYCFCSMPIAHHAPWDARPAGRFSFRNPIKREVNHRKGRGNLGVVGAAARPGVSLPPGKCGWGRTWQKFVAPSPIRRFTFGPCRSPGEPMPCAPSAPQCPCGHFLFWNHSPPRMGMERVVPVAMPLRAFFVLERLEGRGHEMVPLNKSRNALAGIFCFGTKKEVLRTCMLPHHRRNALAGIFCFGTGEGETFVVWKRW